MPSTQHHGREDGKHERESVWHWMKRHPKLVVPAVLAGLFSLVVAVMGWVPTLMEEWFGRDEGARNEVATCMDRFDMTQPKETTVSEGDVATGEWRRQVFEACVWPREPYTDAFGHYEIEAVTYRSVDPSVETPYPMMAERISATCEMVELQYVTAYNEDLAPVRVGQGQQIYADDGRPWDGGDRIFAYAGPEDIAVVHGFHTTLGEARCVEP